MTEPSRPTPTLRAVMARLARTEGEAERQMRRTVGTVYAVGALLFTASVTSLWLQQRSLGAGWWTVLATGASVVGPVAIGVCARLRSRLPFVVAVTTLAAAYVLALVTMVPAHDGRLPPEVISPWLLQTPAIATTAVALAHGFRVCATVIAVTSTLLVVDRLLGSSPTGLLVVLQDALTVVTFCLLLGWAASSTIAAARRLDRETETMCRDGARVAAARASELERTRRDALVHDLVLSTLLVAARSDPELHPAVSHHATRTLAALERYGRHDDGPVGTGELVSRLHGVVTLTDGRAEFAADVDQGSGAEVPGTVADALSEATAEALRNSSRHAPGPDRGPVRRSVGVVVRSGWVAVSVVDDGVGFDPLRVPVDRLGIRVSIHDRMESVTGGSAEVESSTAGTTVRLRWQR